MSAYEEYQLFELDLVEAQFKAIILAAVSSQAQPIQVLMKGETQTNDTPRVELVLETQQNQEHRYILNPQAQPRFQPRDVWFFKLSATVVTNREENGVLHLQLIGKTRLALQFYKLAPVFIEPLHSIIDIGEAPIQLSVETVGNLQSTKMNFAGQLCIRQSAWDLIK